MPKKVLKGTVSCPDSIDEEADATTLRQAMKGAGTDEDAIIELMTSRTAAQRKAIAKQYATMVGRDLLEDLESELSGNFKKVILGLCHKPFRFEALCLRKAMQGAGTDEDVLTQIIATKSNEEIEKLTRTYKKMFDRDLQDDVKSEVSGHYGRVLASILGANRGSDDSVDNELAFNEAKQLYEAGENRWGTDEGEFIRILCSRSRRQLYKTFKVYYQLAGKTIVDSIESEMSGNLKESLKAVAYACVDLQAYFATVLHKSMKGLGTDDSTLVRVLVSRCEYDLQNIKEEFEKIYEASLADWVASDTSSHYRKALLALLGSA